MCLPVQLKILLFPRDFRGVWKVSDELIPRDKRLSKAYERKVLRKVTWLFQPSYSLG